MLNKVLAELDNEVLATYYAVSAAKSLHNADLAAKPQKNAVLQS